MDEYGAAFGFFPQLKPRRNINTDTSSLPLDVFRGRLAGLLGAPSDILNLLSSPKPMEVFGDVDYSRNPQLPYGSEQWLKELPLPPTSQAGNVLGKAASFVPLNPAPVIRGVQKVGQMAGEELAATMLGQRPSSLLDKVVPKPMFAVAPEQGLLAPNPIEQATSLLQTKPQAPVSDIGFYSAAEQAAMNIKRNAGPGQAMLNDILKGENVKADEIKWMGLDEFLKDKKNVTKQEVQDYIAQNRVDVKEVQLGGAEPYDANRLKQLESEYKTLKQHPIDDPAFGEEKYDELIRLMNIRDQSTTQSLYNAAEEATRDAQRAQQRGNKILAEKYFREAEFLNTRAEKLDLQGQGMSNPPKFGQYTLPGGENYREILLTMPNVKGGGLTAQESQRLNALVEKRVGSSLDGLNDVEQKEYFALIKKREEAASGYKSSHWDQPNVLAHMRVNDRVDADGKKMLLIEEVQSDWHQAGRTKGYQTNAEQKYVEYLNDLEKRVAEDIKQVMIGEGFPENRAVTLGQKMARKMADDPRKLADYLDEGDRQMSLHQARIADRNAVPDAPFKDNWYQLALKRAIKYAADNGYERIGLTTGARQAERYDLSKQVDEIAVPMVNADGSRSVRIDPIEGTSIKLIVDDKGIVKGYGAGSTQFSGKRIDEVVGKEMAEKIMLSKEPTTFSGVDLSVGGEGMKKYYDEIYPKFLDKYGKKWNAKVGETTIPTERSRDASGIPSMYPQQEPVRYIDITPEMKAGVEKGQPLFSAIPAAAVPGLLDEEKRKELTSLLE